jgi:pyridoxamine 5'-phosphate oxidase
VVAISDLRRDYTQRGLSEDEAASDPFIQFRIWFDQAVVAQVPEPNAMTLATIGAEGQPSARVVLLKDFDERGFVFYTNYQSRKAADLLAHPRAALVFFWPDLERQIRVEGSVTKASSEESDTYFNSRPLGSRIGAWASPQSQVIASRDVLDQRYRQLQEQYGSGEVPRPPHWGGFRVVPNMFEFWQGRTSRLHDRLRYCWNQNAWARERLAS